MATQTNTHVVVKTTEGNFVIELNEEKAPISVKNFLKYVDEKHYDGVIFHRVMSNFMIQGGGFEPGMKRKDTHDPIKNESNNGLKNDNGTISMARTNVFDSATDQFFINVKDNDFLNNQYAVFGKVVNGMDVIKKIKGVPTGQSGPHGDVPKEDVIIHKIERVTL